MGVKRHDWKPYERRYLAGEWPSLEAMAIALKAEDPKNAPGISMIRKMAMKGRWNVRRTEKEQEADKRIAEDLVQEEVSEARAYRKKMLGVSRMLIAKGVERIVQKITNKQGVEVPKMLDSDSAALGAIRLGAEIEKFLLLGEGSKIEELPAVAGAGEGGTFPAGGPMLLTQGQSATSQAPEINLRGFTINELEGHLRALRSANARDTDHTGAARKKKGGG